MCFSYYRERYKKPSWEVEVPDHKKLNDEEITAFVRCVQTPAMLTMFSHTGTHDAGIVFHRLSLLRPEIIVPPLLEQLVQLSYVLVFFLLMVNVHR